LIKIRIGRKSFEDKNDYVLKEPQNPYNRVLASEKGSLRLKNDYLWQASP
jgi:hypothetical protein